MSLSRPRARLTVDGRALTSAEAGLLRLSIDLSVTGAIDAAEVWLWRSSKLADTAAGARVTIEIGESDALEQVLSGEIVRREVRAEAVVLHALASTVTLARKRLARSYVQQSVADVVRDLASGTDIDEVGGDFTLDVYGVDGRRSVWACLVDLASLAGADLGSSAEGALRFVPFEAPPMPDATLRWGADLLACSITEGLAVTTRAIEAHGSASESGADKWHWARRSVSSSAASDVLGSLSTRDAAEAATRARKERGARRAVQGVVTVRGTPTLRAGHVVKLESVPGLGQSELHLLGVRHTLDAEHGFVTRLDVEGKGGGGGLSL